MIFVRLIKLLLPSSSTGTSTATSPDYAGSNGLSSTSDYEDFSLDSILQGNPLVLRFINDFTVENFLTEEDSENSILLIEKLFETFLSSKVPLLAAVLHLPPSRPRRLRLCLQ